MPMNPAMGGPHDSLVLVTTLVPWLRQAHVAELHSLAYPNIDP